MWPSNHLCSELPALDLLLQRFSLEAVPHNEQLVFSCFIDIVECADFIVLKDRGVRESCRMILSGQSSFRHLTEVPNDRFNFDKSTPLGVIYLYHCHPPHFRNQQSSMVYHEADWLCDYVLMPACIKNIPAGKIADQRLLKCVWYPSGDRHPRLTAAR